MSLVSSVIVMTSAWDEELFAEIELAPKDKPVQEVQDVQLPTSESVAPF